MAQAACLWQVGSGRSVAAPCRPAGRAPAGGRHATAGRGRPQYSWACPLRSLSAAAHPKSLRPQPAVVRPPHGANRWRVQATDAEPASGSGQELGSSITVYAIRYRRSTEAVEFSGEFYSYGNCEDLMMGAERSATGSDGVWFYPSSGGGGKEFFGVGFIRRSGVPQGSAHVFGSLASANAVAAGFWEKFKEGELFCIGWEPEELSAGSGSEDDEWGFLDEDSEYAVPTIKARSGVRPDGCYWWEMDASFREESIGWMNLGRTISCEVVPVSFFP